MFSNYSEIKLGINSRNIVGKPPNIRKLNKILLSDTWVNEKVSREIK